MTRCVKICCLIIGTLIAEEVNADLEGRYVRSIEWIVDTSDLIGTAVVVGEQAERSLRLEKLLKHVDGAAGSLWAQELAKFVPWHKAKPGDRLLVFARQGKEKQPAIHEIVYLKKTNAGSLGQRKLG